MRNIFLTLFLLTSILSFSQEIKELPPDEVPFTIVEQVPVYPGCDKSLSNAKLKNCMSQKISEHISKKFNLKLAENLGLSPGMKRILATFKIDKKGKIIGIKARGPHPKIEEETIRVIKTIPDMESPGMVDGEPVIVPYSLPIMIKIAETKPLTKKELKKLKKN